MKTGNFTARLCGSVAFIAIEYPKTFEHGRARYKLQRGTFDRPCRDTDIYEFSP